MEIQARLLEDKFYLLLEYFQAKEHHYQASMPFFWRNCKVQCLFPQLVACLEVFEFMTRPISEPLRVSLSFQGFFQRVEIFFFQIRLISRLSSYEQWIIHGRFLWCAAINNNSKLYIAIKFHWVDQELLNLCILFREYKNTASCLFLYITSQKACKVQNFGAKFGVFTMQRGRHLGPYPWCFSSFSCMVSFRISFSNQLMNFIFNQTC